MKRFCYDSQDVIYDLVIAGGGIYGAAMAYTASLNSLRTVLLEKSDFISSTSANSQKVIHGGLRYLQTLDIKRVIESIREKQRFYFLFPHLVKPLPCVSPTTGWGTKGNEAFLIAFMIYKLIQLAVCKGKLTRNLKKQPRLLSKEEVLQRFPHLNRKTIRGGALWYDGLCVEPERVIISLLKSAAQEGAKIANYAKVESIHRIDNRTLSVKVLDHQEKQFYQLKTRKVALCTGSWFRDDIGPDPVPRELDELTLIRGMNVIMPSLFKCNTSLAVKVHDINEDRFLFIVPWKQYSIGGTHWEECTDPSAPWMDKDKTKSAFRGLIELGIPDKKVIPDILSEHVGFVPGKKGGKGSMGALEQILSHYRLVDREKRKQGDILQVVGVKFTTAFDVVFKALQKLFPGASFNDVLQNDILPCGSPAGNCNEIKAEYLRRYQILLTRLQINRIYDLVGVELPRIVDKYLQPLQKGNKALTEAGLYSGLTAYCVEEEMVTHLDDLIFRRLFPNTPELPAQVLLNTIAGCMAKLLLWSTDQMDREVQQVINKR